MVYIFTLLSGLVEDLDVFQLYSNTSPQRHRVSGIVLAPSFNRAISVGPG